MTLSHLVGVQQLKNKTNKLVLLGEISTKFQVFLSPSCHSNIAFQNVSEDDIILPSHEQYSKKQLWLQE